MDKIDIFNVEKIVFSSSNFRKKYKLDKSYDRYFKEYNFLKQSGIDKSLINKLFKNFLDKLSNDKNYLFKINSSKSSIIHELNINVNKENRQSYINNKINNYKLKCVNNNSHYSKNINNIIKMYPNFSLFRNKEELKILFWR